MGVLNRKGKMPEIEDFLTGKADLPQLVSPIVR